MARTVDDLPAEVRALIDHAADIAYPVFATHGWYPSELPGARQRLEEVMENILLLAEEGADENGSSEHGQMRLTATVRYDDDVVTYGLALDLGETYLEVED